MKDVTRSQNTSSEWKRTMTKGGLYHVMEDHWNPMPAAEGMDGGLKSRDGREEGGYGGGNGKLASSPRVKSASLTWPRLPASLGRSK